MLTVIRAVILPGFVVLIFIFWVRLDAVMGWRGPRIRWLAGPLLLVGAALVAWCIGLFRVLGRGTPLPFVAKTKRLVVSGPYRYVRNPMMWGVGAIIVGTALWVGSLGLWFGFATFILFVMLFVPLYEERDMQQRFGEEYREYCRQVPRWWPRFRTAKGPAAKSRAA